MESSGDMEEAAEVEEDERSDVESEEESEDEPEKQKGAEGVIQIENPNLAKPKNLKARDVDMEKTTELSRREREEIEKQKAHERYMKLQEQGKTEQARKDLGNVSQTASQFEVVLWLSVTDTEIDSYISKPRPEITKEAAEVEEDERSDVESEEESEDEPEKQKGAEGVIQIENPNLAKPKNLKARDVDMEKTTELSRREREEIEKQKAHERYMKLQEQGKTEQARKDLGNVSQTASQLYLILI
ncbi:28 kDa heat- and acid-stable phosphoprotein [Dorcoceras hygrometricum]|nr:28 kDa heat- and acid-stable phosphoprotein [Dorcoceras hygrometricum]